MASQYDRLCDVGLSVSVKATPYDDGYYIKMDSLCINQMYTMVETDQTMFRYYCTVHNNASHEASLCTDYIDSFQFLNDELLRRLREFNTRKLTLVVWHRTNEKYVYDHNQQPIVDEHKMTLLDDIFIEMKFVLYLIRHVMIDMIDSPRDE